MKPYFFSVIIPFYNGQDTIQRCVDSVYRQGLNPEDFEIIVVDDCSSKAEAWTYLVQLSKEKPYAQNLHPMHLKENLRQGGARNRGVEQAKGEYIVFIDQDDWLNDGALSQVKEQLTLHLMDVLMVDFQENRGGTTRCTSNYASNSQLIQTGADYICKNEIPWVPWCYIYNRKFLIDNQLKFAEHVRFEDVDFVMEVTLKARSMTFHPIYGIVHQVSESQTSFVGVDVKRICDLAFIAWRVRMVAERFLTQIPKGASAVMSHHYFMYKALLRRYLWRIPKKEILNILKTYPAEEHTSDWLTRFAIKHPQQLASIFAFLRPGLNGLWRLKQLLKK